VKKMQEEKEMDIYTEEGLGDYCDNDEIDPGEQGFMMGYLASA
jgi:hypothetical protein